MRFASAHGDLRQAVAFSRSHRLQTSWLADNRVTRIEGTRIGQTFGSEATDLFIGSENQRQRLLQFFQIDTLDRGQ